MSKLFKPHKNNIYNFTKTEIATKDGLFATPDEFIDHVKSDEGCLEIFQSKEESGTDDFYVRYFYNNIDQDSVFLCSSIGELDCYLISFETPMTAVKWLNGLNLDLCVLCVVVIDEGDTGAKVHKLEHPL
jgi:hypothetical protein